MTAPGRAGFPPQWGVAPDGFRILQASAGLRGAAGLRVEIRVQPCSDKFKRVRTSQMRWADMKLS